MFSLAIISVLAATPAKAGNLAFEDIVKILQDPSRHVRSIDALLAQPEITAHYRSSYTAVYDSNSLQGATPLNPRVILFGDDAKLTMSFTCAPGNCLSESSGQPGADLDYSNSLELIQWRDETRRFEFRKIDFPENEASGSVKVSEANPRLCMGCHMGPDPRPNWESYPEWPGVYGGKDDHLSGQLAPGESMDSLRRFLASAPGRPRYRWLEQLAEGYENTGRDRQEHNINFTDRLLKLSMIRVVDRIRNTPYYADLRYALSGYSTFGNQLRHAGLDNLGSLADDCVNPRYTVTPPPQFLTSVSQLIRLFYALGEPALPWFLNFAPTLRSEAISPNAVDMDFSRELQIRDPGLVLPPPDADRLISEGWQRIARLPGFESGLKQCIADQGPSIRR
ncbi:MAG: hypothetical protein ACXVCI_05530 [Bdellovibrionota bacterium]